MMKQTDGAKDWHIILLLQAQTLVEIVFWKTLQLHKINKAMK
jgi:hypothetical protein